MKLPRAKNIWENTPFLVAISGLATTLIMIYALRLWRADLFCSFTADNGQSSFTQMLIQNLMETGRLETSSRLGGQNGQQLWGLASSDALHAGILLLISLFTRSSVATQNIYFLLSFPLATMSAVLALRSLRLTPAVSVFSGILYAFMPYHFWRGTEDLLLSAYYMVPLGLCLALWTMDGRLHLAFSRKQSLKENVRANRHLLGPLVIALAMSSTGLHYAFFAAVLVLVSILWRVIRDHQFTRAAGGGFLSLLTLLFGVFLNRLPAIFYVLSAGKTVTPYNHIISTGETYSLKLIDLIIPNSMHQTWTFRYMVSVFRAAEPVTNENTSVALGIFGACGLLLLLFYPIFLSRPDTPEKKLYRNLSVLLYTALLLSSFGGFSSVLYRYAFQDVYAYYQICVFIFFLSLAALSLFMDAVLYGKGSSTQKAPARKEKGTRTGRLAKVIAAGRGYTSHTVCIYRKHRAKLAVFLLPFLFVALFDLIPFEAAYSYAESKAVVTQRQVFFAAAEQSAGDDAHVFVLPYSPFYKSDDSTTADAYTGLIPYLYTESLHFSSGAVRDSESDMWYRNMSTLHGEELLSALRESGYTAIYFDLRKDTDKSSRKSLNELANLVGRQPIPDQNKQIYFLVIR